MLSDEEVAQESGCGDFGGAFAVLRRGVLVVGHLHTDLLGQVLHGLAKAHARVVHEKPDRIAVLATAKAVEELLGRADAE